MPNKKTPSNSDITSFFSALDDAVETFENYHEDYEIQEMPLYSYINSFKAYGKFLALVDKNNHKKIAKSIVNVLANYNDRTIEKKNYIDNTKLQENIAYDLRKATEFRKTLTKTDHMLDIEYNDFEATISKAFNKKYANYNTMIGLLDMYISELEKPFFEWNSIPLEKYMKKQKVTKTPIKRLINEIMKEHEIVRYTTEAKKLIDKFDKEESETS